MVRSLFGRNSLRSVNRTTLALETLEDRWCPSAVSLTDHGHTLKITGNNSDNHVVITQDDSHSSLHVEYDGHSYEFNSRYVTKIKVDLKGGDDDFEYYMGSDQYRYGKSLDVKLGSGNDTCIISSTDGSSSDYGYFSGSLNVNVDAGYGDDDVTLNFGEIHNKVSVNVNLGSGDDTCHANFYGDLIRHANVNLSIYGGSGHDEIDVFADSDDYNHDGSGVDIDHWSKLNVYMDGGYDDDSLSFQWGSSSYPSELDGYLKLRVDGGWGDDTIDVSIYLSDDSDGYLDVGIKGNRGDDSISADIEYGSSDVHIRNAWVDGGSGEDHCDASSDFHVYNCEI